MTDNASPTGGDNRRRYHAPIRQEQARLTRQRVLAAARQLFAQYGYVATTVAAIAAGADVAVPTLYASFGSKHQILTELVLGLKQEAGVYDAVAQMAASTEPHEIVTLAAHITRRFNELAWDVVEVLRAAAKSDAGLTTVWDQVEGARLRDQEAIVHRLAAGDALRAGLDPSHARDLFWALTAHDVFRLLVIERGWSPDEYERWLRQNLREQLLA